MSLDMAIFTDKSRSWSTLLASSIIGACLVALVAAESLTATYLPTRVMMVIAGLLCLLAAASPSQDLPR